MKKIAINGVKGCGKDFIYNKLSAFLLSKNTKRIAMADNLKIRSISEQNRYKKNGSFWEYNFYLRHDIDCSTGDNNVPTDLRTIIGKGYDNISMNEKIQLIEYFKNDKQNFGYKTRTALQLFGDYYKNETNNMFVFSQEVIDIIRTDEQYRNCDYIVNTDCRFLTEYVNFLLDDFIIIRLVHRGLIKSELHKGKPHVSEMELSLYDGSFGYEFDMEGNKERGTQMVEHGITRLNQQGIQENIERMKYVIDNFKGYSVKQKKQLSALKVRIENDTNFWKANEGYLRKNSEDIALTEAYLGMRTQYIESINTIINN